MANEELMWQPKVLDVEQNLKFGGLRSAWHWQVFPADVAVEQHFFSRQ